jgi:hypothetical protein
MVYTFLPSEKSNSSAGGTIPLALIVTAGLFAYWMMRLAWGRGAFLMLLSG